MSTEKRNIQRHGIFKMIDGKPHEVCGWDQDSTAGDGDDDHIIGLLPVQDDGEECPYCAPDESCARCL